MPEAIAIDGRARRRRRRRRREVDVVGEMEATGEEDGEISMNLVTKREKTLVGENFYVLN